MSARTRGTAADAETDEKAPNDSLRTAGSDDPLAGLRQEIASLDRDMLERLAARRRLVRRIAEEKARRNLPVRAPAVEVAGLLNLLEEGARRGLDHEFVQRLFQTVIEDSVLLQQATLTRLGHRARDAVRVACLGAKGSYSQQAAGRFFERRGEKYRPLDCRSFSDAVRMTERGEADFAVLPIENTTSGSINEVYDLLQHTSLNIVGEIRHRIEHQLLALAEGLTPAAIRTLYVHPQVYAQCSHYLAELEAADVVYCTSTTQAMERLVESGDETAAAIGSAEGGMLYGLHVIASDLANQKENHTRFIVAARTPAEVPEGVAAKTTLILTVDQKPGALVDALTVFRDHAINMLKLESRPLAGNPFEELFYIDILGNARDADVTAALDELAARARFLKVLGCYPTDEVVPVALPVPASGRRTESEHVKEGEAAAESMRPAPPTTGTSTAKKAPEAKEAGAPAPKSWRLASRVTRAEATLVTLGRARIGEGFFVIAGPCSVESEEQVMTAAGYVREHGAGALRGGCFKPRTSPYSFQGLGFEGLALLKRAGRRFGLPIVTEVLAPEDVEGVAEHADMLQIGARNMQNFPLLKAVGRTHRPVLLKRGMMASIDELLQAAEYILREGNRQVVLCERGIRTFESATRNTLDLSAVPLLKQLTHLPVIVDPSHAVGRRDLVIPMARAARAVGADGIIVETHPKPEEALSDGPQALTPNMFAELMAELRPADGR
ncbi:MAG: 3-deoxy-7-phosphoheptulonate synthase [Alphaproteobacteria bacterium]|nr:MAG: 3-deoxy-7-phosphoheptulonate synthase [Alphaproteobacteria bacterium]